MSSPAKFPGLLEGGDFLWELLSPWHSFPRHPASLGTSAGTVLSWRTAEVCRAGLEPQREWGSLYSRPCPYTGPPSSPSFPVPAVKPQPWRVSRAPEVLLEVGNTESPAPAAPDSEFTRLAQRRGWGMCPKGLCKSCAPPHPALVAGWEKAGHPISERGCPIPIGAIAREPTQARESCLFLAGPELPPHQPLTFPTSR